MLGYRFARRMEKFQRTNHPFFVVYMQRFIAFGVDIRQQRMKLFGSVLSCEIFKIFAVFFIGFGFRELNIIDK